MANNKKWDDKDMIDFALWAINNMPKQVNMSLLSSFELTIEDKVCNKCQERKHKSRFDKSPSCKMGIGTICKDCRTILRGFRDNGVIDIQGELWVDVIGWEGYYKISTKSRLKRLSRKQVDVSGRFQNFKEKLIKPTISNGYQHVALNRNTYTEKHTLHRLIAIHFIDNPLNKPEVNHKNGVRCDNRMENLEWNTSSEQKIHAFDVLNGTIMPIGDLPENSYLMRPVKKINILTGETISIFESIKEAFQRGDAKNPYSVADCCKGVYKKHNGYKWEYA